jgi:hypothetical protein
MFAAPGARADAERWLARNTVSAWSLAATSPCIDQGDHSPKMITLLAAPPAMAEKPQHLDGPPAPAAAFGKGSKVIIDDKKSERPK